MNSKGNIRKSNIELFRIFAMLLIISHHYVVNSGLLELITPNNICEFNSLFAVLYGWGGKTGIDCFVLITGYYMCKKEISYLKLAKLYGEVLFYNILINIIFVLCGYSNLSFIQWWKVIFPFYDLGSEFVSSYLIFYLFIPFINKLLSNLDKKNHLYLMLLMFICDSILPTFFMTPNAFTYIGLFTFIYIIGAYIRLYSNDFIINKKWYGIMFVLSLIIALGTIVFISLFIYPKIGKGIYYFLIDSNKIVPILVSICGFLFFLNLEIKDNTIINKFASTTLGVLMIHANSAIMRKWLWGDMLKVTEAYENKYFIIHAILAVLAVFLSCAIIDLIRKFFVNMVNFIVLNSLIKK